MYNERRNQRVIVMVERRGMMPKQVAMRLNMTVWNVYQIIHRFRSVKVCQTLPPTQIKKVA